MQETFPGTGRNLAISLSAHESPYISADLSIKIHQRMPDGTINSYVI